jgi:hypothetical protein
MNTATEKQVKLAAKMYEARDSMKFLFGDKYMGKVTEAAKLLRSIAQREKISLMSAVIAACRVVMEKCPVESGVSLGLLTAAAVEMIEGDLRQYEPATE